MINVERLLDAWEREGPTVDESKFTRARDGWSAWNIMSPEVEFCETAAQLVRLIRPHSVLETGIGQGYLTRRVTEALPAGSQYRGFEADESLRSLLDKLPFFARDRVHLARQGTPGPLDYEWASFTILDSTFALRFDEVASWAKYARAGAYVLIHDTGNGHPPSSFHARLHEHIEALGLEGVFFPNPRGSFLGRKR